MSREPNIVRSEGVFNQFSAAIRGFIAKHTSYSADDREDMVQDLFYKFMVSDGEKQIIENVSAWLYRATRNLIIDRSRKSKELRMEQSMQYTLSDSSHDSDPESSIIGIMIQEEVEAALASLPDEQRVVFELHELQGISFKEISQSSGVAINTLISRKRYATQHLRGQLAELYDDIFG